MSFSASVLADENNDPGANLRNQAENPEGSYKINLRTKGQPKTSRKPLGNL